MNFEPTKIKPVTPKALRVYRQLGLLNFENANQLKAQIDIYLESEKLHKLLEVTFQQDFSHTDVDEIDLGKVAQGVTAFLLQLSGVSPK
jgi:hypothetical protein